MLKNKLIGILGELHRLKLINNELLLQLLDHIEDNAIKNGEEQIGNWSDLVQWIPNESRLMVDSWI